MKKRLTAGLLAVCLLTGLTGCSSDQLTEQVTDKLLSSDDGIAFAVDKPVKDDSMTLTVRSITLSDAVYAPLTTDSEGAYTAYYTEDGTGKEQDASDSEADAGCRNPGSIMSSAVTNNKPCRYTKRAAVHTHSGSCYLSIFYFAYSTARLSRMTLTLIWPG